MYLQEIIPLLQLGPTIEFKEPLHIVEAGLSPSSEPCHHEPYNSLFELVCQFQGGLKPDRVLYIGHDAEKARLIYDTYMKAAIHTKGILEAGCE